MTRIAAAARPDRPTLGPDAESFLRRLGRATWIRVPGRDSTRLRVVTTLLHGNEPSGVRALWRWLAQGDVPAVDLGLFVGSIHAALRPPGFAHRMLPELPDLNRSFLPPYAGVSGETARELLALLAERPCEALVDLHNTSGHTPPYAVTRHLDPMRLGIAAGFADRVIQLDLRLGTLLDAIDSRIPAITVECGRGGDPDADDVALTGLEHFVSSERIAPLDPGAGGARIFHSAVQVRLRPGATVHYGAAPDPRADLTLDLDLDRHNFELRGAGTRLGWLSTDRSWPLEARSADGGEVSRELFRTLDGRLELTCPRMPIMVTTQAAIARSDCLFYLVEPAD